MVLRQGYRFPDRSPTQSHSASQVVNTLVQKAALISDMNRPLNRIICHFNVNFKASIGDEKVRKDDRENIVLTNF